MQTLILGFDAFDPNMFEQLSAQGRLPHLTRYAEQNGYARFSVANPPQSEVSWTSIATGMNPGGHGIFDFVHRDPANYGLYVSLLPTKRGPFGTQFSPPYQARTIFEQATHQGFPATVLWWPATFPARPESPVRTVPGLGTPDIHGRLGVGTLYSTNPEPPREGQKTPQETLHLCGKNQYKGQLKGPLQQKRARQEAASLELQLALQDEQSARLTLGRQSVDLKIGRWSPILELTFQMGLFVKVRVLTRVILTRVQPDVQLYFLPLQLHPLHSPWRYGTPKSFLKELWGACGPFLTLGWPQDTTGLEDGCITDDQFLDLCESIFAVRQQILLHQLERFHEGILAAVFDTLDRVQHMFWRDRPDIVEKWYVKLDTLVGQVEQRLATPGRARTKLLIVSDHGFADFDHKVHLNRWLVDHGYLFTKQGEQGNSLQAVDWSQSKAYAIGLNSLYLNLAQREGQGSVQANDVAALTDRLRTELMAWQGPNGSSVVQHVWRGDEAFNGPYTSYGPDLVVGYGPGYRGSAQTGLGRWEQSCVERNQDHWGADHCIDPRVVPGVLFSEHDLRNHPHPSYLDIPVLTIGTAVQSSDTAPPPPPSADGEGQDVVEERLKSLGYL
jgi:predicted AlkP superfamily phosphohydrolase/phosphomutase